MKDDLDIVSRAKLVNRSSLERKVAEEAEDLEVPYFDLRENSLSKETLENFSRFFWNSSKDFSVRSISATSTSPAVSRGIFFTILLSNSSFSLKLSAEIMAKDILGNAFLYFD